ncbi:hypothetical protein [Gordonia sp. NPDC003376]
MTDWFTRTIVDTGRLPVFMMMVAFVLTFLFIRFSVRMIRAEVSWWPGNVEPGGLHIHHVVFGMVLVLISGFAFIALANYHTPIANAVLGSLFGIGAALVLDEFALILHLRDVYWSQEGRTSIDAIFVALAVTGLFVLGVHPIGLSGDFSQYESDRQWSTLAVTLTLLLVQYGLAVIVLLKGKIWTGLVGLFIVPFLVVGAIRLGRPRSPWARFFYRARPRTQERAVSREKRLRQPISRAKIRLQEAVAGRFDTPAE